MAAQVTMHSVAEPWFRACERFLYNEAELLDDLRWVDWLELLTDDITYEIPVRVTRQREGGVGTSKTAFHLREDHSSLTTRMTRLELPHAWVESPPSRSRRIVGNIRPALNGEHSSDPAESDGQECDVRSNLLMIRTRGDSTDVEQISGERFDRLRVVKGQLRLARRHVVLDQTTLAWPILGVPI